MNKVLKISIVIVLCLIVVLMITLFACNSNGGGDDKKTTTTTTTTTTKKPEPCVVHMDEDADGVCDVCGEPMPKEPCDEHVDEDEDGKCDVCGEDMPVAAPSDFVEVNDTVYVIAGELNVRTSPNAEDSDNIKSSVKYGAVLTRTGYSEDGWTRIDVDGVALYVRSTYVTTDKPILESEFKDVNETVYVTNENGLSMRSTPYLDSTSNNIITSLPYGTSAKRTGIATREFDEITWSRLEIELEVKDDDGKVEKKTYTVYASSKYLSTEDPTKVDTDNGIKFEKNNDVLTVIVDFVNLRNAALSDVSSVATSVKKGTVLQATAKGVESDKTVWYKVEYEGEVYYVIYNSVKNNKVYFDVSDSTTTKHDLFDGNVTITLPTDFTNLGLEDGISYYFDSPETLILVGYVVNENKDIKSTEDMAKAKVADMEFDESAPKVYVSNGIAYFSYTTTTTDNTTGEKVTIATCVTIIKGEGEGYAVIEYHCDPDDFDINVFFGYARTVKVK